MLLNPFQPLLLIGSEEGLPGLFSGLMPSILAGLVSVWGAMLGSYAFEIGYKKIVIKFVLIFIFCKLMKESEVEHLEQQDRELIQHTRSSLSLIIPFLVNSLRYPFDICSTVMAVTGSGYLTKFILNNLIVKFIGFPSSLFTSF